MFKNVTPRIPPTPEERAALVLDCIGARSAQGEAVTAARIALVCGLSAPEAEAALQYLLHSALPLLAMTMQRTSAGHWRPHYFTLEPGQIKWALPQRVCTR
jgi:hypothetical protein